MPIRPCIFCSHAAAASVSSVSTVLGYRPSSPDRVKRIAIPVYRSRVSPVLDTCTRLLLIDLRGGRETARVEIRVAGDSLFERTDMLRQHRVDAVICAGISQQLYDLLRAAGIALITGIAGNIEQVRAGYVTDRLEHPSFHMPGADRGDRFNR
jgi:predicted Fe-Mo cluster-binding NifX family protein